MGLKRDVLNSAEVISAMFQTDPRGVEAIGYGSAGRFEHSFQTDPRGVEAAATALVSSRSEGRFRRTLVGLKRESG